MPDPGPVTSSSAAPATIAGSAPSGRAPARPPNVFWVQVDDVGIEHLAVYSDCNDPTWTAAAPYPSTPTIDALAADGVRFRRNYALPSCSPTKAANLTGRSSVSTLISGVINFDDSYRLPGDSVSAQKVAALRGSVHAFAHFGKDHLNLGMAEADRVAGLHGVDRYIGCPTNLDKEANTGYGGELPVPTTSYFSWDSLTGVLTEKTTYNPEQEYLDIDSWLGAAGTGRPFFVSWWMHSCHSPYHWPPGKLPEPTLSAWSYYKGMLEEADKFIGYALATLDDEERANTVVIFSTDNGTPSAMVDASYVGHNVPGGGAAPPDVYDPEHFKSTPFEGGCRAPLIISGPGFAKGAVCDALTWACDIMPTLAELLAAGAAEEFPSSVVGKSLVPLLTTPQAEHHDLIHVATWEPEGVAVSDSSVTGLEVGAWSQTTGYKLILTRSSVASPMSERLYKIGLDPENPDDRHEQNQYLPGQSDESDAAFVELYFYLVGVLGFAWETNWEIPEALPT